MSEDTTTATTLGVTEDEESWVEDIPELPPRFDVGLTGGSITKNGITHAQVTTGGEVTPTTGSSYTAGDTFKISDETFEVSAVTKRGDVVVIAPDGNEYLIPRRAPKRRQIAPMVEAPKDVPPPSVAEASGGAPWEEEAFDTHMASLNPFERDLFMSHIQDLMFVYPGTSILELAPMAKKRYASTSAAARVALGDALNTAKGSSTYDTTGPGGVPMTKHVIESEDGSVVTFVVDDETGETVQVDNDE